jgi:hypothetical protein
MWEYTLCSWAGLITVVVMMSCVAMPTAILRWEMLNYSNAMRRPFFISKGLNTNKELFIEKQHKLVFNKDKVL